ncbi:hypothetical protein LTR91_010602 [Friedmanniomyces endolithicus]|uniref:Uncharacterized protein n=1 Tax=Friedmanniomyces endolithicus TaxID=329885 RepID=A0A4U0UV01_9PEZI|nr:hypothetical protein LTS09_015205 [Friedmanniomyces endolithicus]KAK0269052.1 hypothetical protein LTR35_015147 [Friedmanniomyces endolithicus]KAK0286437.1 hypothetical protein LTS00_010375 [Friedmanniomyces endolithicus]KAK0306054.1 hypothetical protein LTR01_006402 [Friedmanniomyces endolithicus]KAK0317264.1 hypothetical protein LTR82_011865 [Friedmanniomyces endolithicus]
MASQVIINFKSIGEQIGTAIRGSIEDVNKELVALTANQMKQEPQALDVRAQILDNARALWPIIDGKRMNYFGQFMPPRVTPAMHIIAVGTGTISRAVVVRGEYNTNDQPICSPRLFVFLQSEGTDSVENAQRKLLKMTMLMLHGFMSTNVYITGTKVEVNGHGHYSVPTMGSQ